MLEEWILRVISFGDSIRKISRRIKYWIVWQLVQWEIIGITKWCPARRFGKNEVVSPILLLASPLLLLLYHHHFYPIQNLIIVVVRKEFAESSHDFEALFFDEKMHSRSHFTFRSSNSCALVFFVSCILQQRDFRSSQTHLHESLLHPSSVLELIS